MNEIKNWWPYSYRTQHEQNKHCLILLNQPILDAALAVRLWTGSSMKVTVDGGTSIWAKLINNSQYSIEKEVPDLITGDFDSADKENIEYFKRMGAEVIETMDQDRTDFTKCLDEVGKRIYGRTSTTTSGQISGTATTTTSGHDISVVYAYVENSGRLDQIMANIQTLFFGKEYLGSIPLYLINSQSISWLLQPGKHSIHLPEEALLVPGKSEAEVLDSLHCGLIPLAGPSIVSSTGLKWNLNADELKFGALVSTSNAFASKEIVIETNKPLLWTMDIIT